MIGDRRIKNSICEPGGQVQAREHLIKTVRWTGRAR